MATAGQRLFEDGGHAARFRLIRSGQVFLDLHVPGQDRIKIDTVGLGEVLGWSWLFRRAALRTKVPRDGGQ